MYMRGGWLFPSDVGDGVPPLSTVELVGRQ